MKISKETIVGLLNEVVIPFEKYVMEDEKVSKYLNNEHLKTQHYLDISKLALALVYDLSKAKQLLITSIQTHKAFQIDIEIIKKYTTIFFKLHKNWSKEHLGTDEYYDEVMERVNLLFLRLYKENLNNIVNEKIDEEDFLMFDSEEIDEAIEEMHYSDDKKISAEEYASYKEILDDDLDFILELKEDCELIITKYNTLNENYLEDFSKVIETLSKILFVTIEFKDVGYALENFNKTLNELPISNFDENQKNLTYTLLTQMNEDIQNWIKSLFIEQDAVDIHYFDASFLANIAQFSMMLAQETEIEESEDSFLF